MMLKFNNSTKGYFGTKCLSKGKNVTDNNKLKPRSLQEISDLNCKTAVVVGGEEGIGYATAHEIFSNKAKVVGIHGKNVCKGMEACQALNCAICKFSDEIGKIDVFVNTFAICDGKNWENELNTNLIGMARCTIAAHTYLSETKKGGVIVNSSGIFGMIPSAGCPTTSAAQHGIIGLSKSFGKEPLFKHTNVLE